MPVSHRALALPRLVRILARFLAVALVPLALVGPLATPASAQTATTTALASSANPSTVGQSVTFTATVSGSPMASAPTGQVNFLDGGTQIGTGTLATDAGGTTTATFMTSALTQGTHPITASYVGTPDGPGGQGNAPSTSAPLSQEVTAGSAGTTTTTTTSTTSTTVCGAGGCPTTTTTTAPSTTTTTVATTTTTVPPTTTTTTIAGEKVTPVVTLTSAQNPVGANVFVDFTITVARPTGSTGPTPSGIVFLNDGFGGSSMQIAGDPLTSGGTLTTSWVKFNATGSHPIVATYQGDANYLTANSNQVLEVVTGGTVSGKIISAATSSTIPGAAVWAVPTGSGFSTTATADSLGDYSLLLGPGSWMVWSGAGPNGNHLQSSINVTVVDGQNLTGQNITLTLPQEMPPNTSFNTTQGLDSSGSPTLMNSGPMTFTTQQCPGGTVTLTIVSDVGGAIPAMTLVETPPGSGTYTVTFDATTVLAGHHGDTVFTITVTCPGAGTTGTSFDGYIDPSGTVVDQTGKLIQGATVILQDAPTIDGPYTAVPNGSIVMSPSNRVNPWPTKADGKYAWDVLPGFYRVVASAPGCTTLTSPHFAIPPEVTDLTMMLTCETKVRRFAGTDRLNTAVLVSQGSFTSGAAGAVVLARADDFADALASGPLATARSGPLLLTATSSLDSGVRAEVARVLPTGRTVYIAGGTGAVSEAVADTLRADGFTVTRISGENRYATATEIADAVVAAMGTPVQAALLATGTDFADGLVAGPAAAKLRGVVLLTSGRNMPAATAAWLAARPGLTTYAVGGPAAAAAPAATSIVGSDRYATATAVATRFFTNPSLVGVVSGVAFPDALVGAARLGANNAPLVLTAPAALSSATQSYLSGLSPRPGRFEVYGGTNAVGAGIDEALTNLAA